MDSFNLIDRPWIPVLYRDGHYERVGIRQALTEAHRIRLVAASNPMDRVAVLRFLLALLYWCKGNPPAESAGTRNTSFAPEWFKRLDEYRECFNLLGSGKRLYQHPSARRKRTVTDLIQEIPSGNNYWHIRHATDGMDGLCPSCCALGLIRLPLFAVSGLPDLKAGINGVPPMYIVPWGNTLLQTLSLNWVPVANIGEPSWAEGATPVFDQEVPLLDGLTRLSRRIWLHDPSEPSGSCFSCGVNEDVLIRTCEHENAGRQETEWWNDPHVLYIDGQPRKNVKAPNLTARDHFKMDRPWSALLRHLVQNQNRIVSGETPGVFVTAFVTDKMKYIDVWEEYIQIKTPAKLQESVAQYVQHWEKERQKILDRVKHITRSKMKGPCTVSAICPNIEKTISRRLSELIESETEALKQAAEEYRPMMRMISKSLSPGFTATALTRRKEIARTIPQMKPKS